MSTKKRVCVIGAGAAGLSAIKNSIDYGLEVECFEQSKEVGGTWNYSDNFENMTFEDEVHSSTYQGLHTNAPKEVMGFPGFEYPEEIDESFVSSEKVLTFLRSFAKNFNLEDHIKFSHSVIRVRPRKDNWEVILCDLSNNHYFTSYFDFVFVCNGHYTKPQYPSIEGMDIYKGRQSHSHLFRKSEHFKDENVLVIGAGPSGIDITNLVHNHAKHVYLSHHLKSKINSYSITNITQVPDVKRFTENGAILEDGSEITFSSVIYCTGYKYSFPFLSVDSEIRLEENSVFPLYKHCININHPTMSFIGLPYVIIPPKCFDLQIRFSLQFFTGKRQLPSRQEMEADLEEELATRLAAGIPKRHFHVMDKKQYDYYKTLSEVGGVENIPTAVQEIMKDLCTKYLEQWMDYRKMRYRVVNNEKFIKL